MLALLSRFRISIHLLVRMSRGKLVISRMSVSGKGMRQRLHTRGRRCSLGLPPAAAGAGRR
jgi:hypothetical protein